MSMNGFVVNRNDIHTLTRFLKIRALQITSRDVYVENLRQIGINVQNSIVVDKDFVAVELQNETSASFVLNHLRRTQHPKEPAVYRTTGSWHYKQIDVFEQVS